MNDTQLALAYRHCLARARGHYENFPVASWLLPRRLRGPVAVVYTFAREADDAADEGGSERRRLAELDRFERLLEHLEAGKAVADDPLAVALGDVVARFALPLRLFRDLLSAFRQDVTQRRYRDFAQVLDYCRRSADPVGRILLHLHGDATAENLRLSDRICSALQLINFYQDLWQDYSENDRIYLPQDEMLAHGVGEDHFRERRGDPALVELMALQRQRARHMLEEGTALCRHLHGRFGWEIRLIAAAGLTTLDKLDQSRATPFARPRLRRWDYLRIAARAARL